MGFNCGIVGLPNVGKSTLFNALTTSAAAEIANYPFTTIEPNVGRVTVPDPRLGVIAGIEGSARAVATRLEFVDIAGLVRGASRGEGLGNRFLAGIREVDAVAHVLRCFLDDDVAHVDGSVDPVRDADVVETELMLADLESLERRVDDITRKARSGEADAKAELARLEPIVEALNAGTPARALARGNEAAAGGNAIPLLTAKPVLYVCNVGEEDAKSGNAMTEAVAERAASEDAGVVIVSAKVEAELAELDDADERRQFLDALGVPESGLDRVIRAGYALLELITFFTANANEAHAWTIRRGTPANHAAGAVHTDFQRGFISAETVSFDDLVACGGEHAAREAGRMREHGRDYVVADGDVIQFRFNV
ncbi:MAG: redox-regulated ATPase YchF [Rhodospirillales bacterium]|jgi:hypothetical protein|nr:redox-regulated ATPase YchF [Rhodospirillales bacterium]MDP6804912.1 redox-regulated ATPase YchF [Rhodospirillales bacterium]